MAELVSSLLELAEKKQIGYFCNFRNKLVTIHALKVLPRIQSHAEINSTNGKRRDECIRSQDTINYGRLHKVRYVDVHLAKVALAEHRAIWRTTARRPRTAVKLKHLPHLVVRPDR